MQPRSAGGFALTCWGGVTRELSELEKILLDACKVALRQLEYDGDDNTAFHGAAWEALTKAFAAAEPTP